MVGESGCGKSTLGRVVMGIYHPTKGKILYRNKEVNLKHTRDRFAYSRKAQIIFQDPYASLNPRMTVGTIIAEGMEIHNMYDKAKRQERVYELLENCRPEPGARQPLSPTSFPAVSVSVSALPALLAIEPEFIVCDEPISALDVSIQSQIINLLKDLQKKLNLTYMFIAHDLNIVKYISDRIAVMYLGNLVELADSDAIYAETLHPYSRALLSSVPIPDPDKEAQKKAQVLSGDVPSPINPKPGCPFANRCPQRHRPVPAGDPGAAGSASRPLRGLPSGKIRRRAFDPWQFAF